jgi:hypothetical protein
VGARTVLRRDARRCFKVDVARERCPVGPDRGGTKRLGIAKNTARDACVLGPPSLRTSKSRRQSLTIYMIRRC